MGGGVRSGTREGRAERDGAAGGGVDRLLTARDVLALTGYRSRTTLWRKVRARAFPAPVKLTGSALRWKAVEVQAWIDEAPRQDYGRDA